MPDHKRLSLIAASAILGQMEPDQVVAITGDGTFRFDMNHTLVENPQAIRGVPGEKQCDTAGCILGLAHLLEKVQGRSNTWGEEYNSDSDVNAGREDPYYRLFYPNSPTSYDNITPKQAAAAITEFLAGNDSPRFDHE
jgi:hypothetical protein